VLGKGAEQGGIALVGNRAGVGTMDQANVSGAKYDFQFGLMHQITKVHQIMTLQVVKMSRQTSNEGYKDTNRII
jgi:hypothetical protein